MNMSGEWHAACAPIAHGAAGQKRKRAPAPEMRKRTDGNCCSGRQVPPAAPALLRLPLATAVRYSAPRATSRNPTPRPLRSQGAPARKGAASRGDAHSHSTVRAPSREHPLAPAPPPRRVRATRGCATCAFTARLSRARARFARGRALTAPAARVYHHQRKCCQRGAHSRALARRPADPLVPTCRHGVTTPPTHLRSLGGRRGRRASRLPRAPDEERPLRLLLLLLLLLQQQRVLVTNMAIKWN